MKAALTGISVSLFLLLLPFLGRYASGERSDFPAELSAPSVFSLSLEGDILSAKIKKAPLQDVLEKLAHQTRLLIDVDGSIEDEVVSAEFDALPLEIGIKRLLRHQSYMLLYSEIPSVNGSPPLLRVDGIKIAGKIEVSPLLPTREARRTIREFQESREREPEEEEQDALPEQPAPHESPFSMPSPIERAVSHANPDIRMEALDELAEERGMAAIPTLRQAARTDPDEEVRSFAKELIEEIQEDSSD